MHIRPFLAQSYSDEDTSTYILGLMPACLREGGRRIRHELRLDGRWLDHHHLAAKCRQLVYEEQKSAKPQTGSAKRAAGLDERNRRLQ